jgi:ribosomal-protein-alanine N-acetyltransferase
MRFTVRHAGEGDLRRVVEIERACETAPHWGVGEYRMILEGGGSVLRCLLVAEAARGVVGFAVGMVVGEVGELESVAVDAAARRCGVGAALCGAVIAWCRANGVREVELEVRAASVGVRRLYEGMGFIEGGRRRKYYEQPEDDAVLMRLRLNG